jgi:uncharacterized protein (DUF433 family)
MLRNEGFLALPEKEREALSVRINSDFIQLTNPSTWSIIELRDEPERRLVERVYRAVPPLSKQLTGPGDWNLELHRELHMTDDAWRFRKRDWLLERGCQPRDICFIAPLEEYYKSRSAEYVAGVRYIVPDGTRYRVASVRPPDAHKSRKARVPVLQAISGFLRRDRADDENELPVVPGAAYVPLYEGRMVQQFDHAAKAYVGGEGRGAKWRDLDYGEKHLVAHYFVDGEDFTSKAVRTGICKVTGQTNERSALTSLIPSGLPTGESLNVAFVDRQSPATDLALISSINSFVVDFLLRQKVLTNLSQFHLAATPIWRPRIDSHEFTLLASKAARLASITPEIQLAEPALDPRERAQLRSEIDSIVAGLYDLSPAEFAYILTTFPLLDRDQPPLPDDFFVRWNKQGKPRLEPRSYVTRDTALLAFFRHRGIAPPDDLAVWYRDGVAVNMIDDESCSYRIGPIRNMEQRVAEAHRRGAIAYIPSKAKKWDPSGPYQPPDLPADWQEWIVTEPSICNGRPTMRGTRLELAQLQSLLEKKTFAELLASFPQLDYPRIAVALVSMSHC